MSIKTAERAAIKTVLMERITEAKRKDHSESLIGHLEGNGTVESATVIRSGLGWVEVKIVPASYTERITVLESGTTIRRV